MGNKKIKTYMDQLMEDKEFRVSFDKEYSKLLTPATIFGASGLITIGFHTDILWDETEAISIIAL